MINKPLLIIASSGRMLAQSAVKAGYQPVVIDLFGDQDTMQISLDGYTVSKLDLLELKPVIDQLHYRYDFQGVVYGSGFEAFPDSLQLFADRLNIFGNSLQTFKSILDKKKFFRILRQCGIPYPETRFIFPRDEKKWLLKPYAGEGGVGIIYASHWPGQQKKSCYWQQYINGVPMSVLFLADGFNERIIGFNRQWTLTASFQFSGLINQASLPELEKQRIQGWIKKLIAAFSLKGLNSLDFVWDGENSWVLEINPRPSASLALYDEHFARGLLIEHIEACTAPFLCGRLNTQYLLNSSATVTNHDPSMKNGCRTSRNTTQKKPFSAKIMTAYQVLYADRGRCVPVDIDWPEWSMDRPQQGSKMHANQPVCSIIAKSDSSRKVFDLLHNRQQIMINKLKGNKIHGIHCEC